jgi:hypothetical protein
MHRSDWIMLQNDKQDESNLFCPQIPPLPGLKPNTWMSGPNMFGSIDTSGLGSVDLFQITIHGVIPVNWGVDSSE